MFSLESLKDKFKGVPKESFDTLINLATEVNFSKNEIITKTGDISKDFYFLKSGLARSFHTDEKGKEYTRSIFIPGNTTGSLGSLISKTPSKLTYQCLTNCVLYKFVYDDFIQLTKKDNHLLALYVKMMEGIFLLMESKIYELSVLNATQRYLRLKHEIPDIETLIPQYHIASFLNVSPVQLSRIRKEIYSK